MARTCYTLRRRRVLFLCLIAAIVLSALAFPLARPSLLDRPLSTASSKQEVSEKEDNTGEHAPRETQAAPERTLQEPVGEDEVPINYLIRDMEALEAFLVDEVHLSTIFAPMLNSDESHFRNVGLRTRLFEEALRRWDSIHIDPAQKVFYAQNFLTRLRAIRHPSFDFNHLVFTYDRFRGLISQFSSILFPWTLKYYSDHMSFRASFFHAGRGIVTTAGNRQAQFLFVTIPMLRKIGCTLPIEILYLGDTDLDEANRDRLNDLPGVTTRDLKYMVDDQGWTLGGWAAKPFAILMSSFRHVIFIDADAIFFQDPQILLHDPQYRETGALFFHDRLVSPGSKRDWIQSILPQPISSRVKKNRLWTGESTHMQESGVIVVDKYKHFVPLLLTTRLNGPDRDSDETKGKKGMYSMVYGDKETFWLSWELAGGHDYAFFNGSLGNMRAVKNDDEANTTAKGNLLEDAMTHNPNSTPDRGDALGNDTAEANDERDRQALMAKQQESMSNGQEFRTTTEQQNCSPQLLHIDRDGNPLWFNGWVSTDKFTAVSKFAKFDRFLVQPPELGRATRSSVWEIRANNVVCLRSTTWREFNPREKKFLDELVEMAVEQYESNNGA